MDKCTLAMEGFGHHEGNSVRVILQQSCQLIICAYDVYYILLHDINQKKEQRNPSMYVIAWSFEIKIFKP